MQDVKILIAKAEQQLVDVGRNASKPPLYYVHVEIMSFRPVIIRVWSFFDCSAILERLQLNVQTDIHMCLSFTYVSKNSSTTCPSYLKTRPAWGMTKGRT